MGLEKIISVGGKPGLFELLSQTKNSFIVKDLESGKKSAISAQYNIVMLNNVAIFTEDEDLPLENIFTTIFEKENGGTSISPKEDAIKLFDYFSEIVPNYNKERVYHSDLKKLFKWYEILHKIDLLKDLISQESEISVDIEEEKPQKKETKKRAKVVKENE